MSRVTWRIVLAMVVPWIVVGASWSAQAGFLYQTLDAPNSVDTIGNGINNAGQVVGRYSDSMGYHSYLESGGGFTTLNAPSLFGGLGSVATDINNSGQLSGYYYAPSGDTHGYLNLGGAFLTTDVLGARSTEILGINDSADFVGFYTDNLGNHAFVFLQSLGMFTTLNTPGADARALGINNSRQIVGRYTDGTGTHGFVLSGGIYTTLDVPGATGNTIANGINGLGQIVGTYSDATGRHGFIESGGIYTTLDVPGSTNLTLANGLNDSGQIVGTYFDRQNLGFLATPVPEPSTMVMAATAAVAGLFAYRRLRIEA